MLVAGGVNVVLDPGDYWITVALGNDSSVNGTAGIAGSSLGDGPAFFSGPGLGEAFALGNPAAYRISGTVVPAPAGGLLLTLAFVARRSRRRR